jgi:cytochrome P450
MKQHNIDKETSLMPEPQYIDSETLRLVLKDFARERSPLAAMQVLFTRMERFFQIPLPGFKAYVVGGPQANRQVLVTERNKLLWRSQGDPVTTLLRQGVLVIDGQEHDDYRSVMEPLLAPAHLPNYVPQILHHVDRVASSWTDGQTVDMLMESRRIALLIIMDTLLSVDFWDDLPRMLKPILKTIEYISPGAWIVFPKLPRLGYLKSIKDLDQYLFGLIQARRNTEPIHDLLGHLIDAGLDDERIRDQILTMLIAGHDTSTALLAWTFYLLGKNPEMVSRLETDLDEKLQGQPPRTPAGWQPPLLDEVIKETLRLYPPIHLGSRRVAESIDIDGHCVPVGERLIYSIYLTHRDPGIWEEPDEFKPERFAHGRKQPPFAYVPFGGGPRACIGAAFGQAEARLVIARLLQTYQFQLTNPKVHTHMGATLEPRPGVFMQVRRKTI